MRCESCGPDKQLARRLVEQKRVELRAGHLGEAVRAPYDKFLEMVLEKLEQKERAAATIREVESVLSRFGAICDPAGVASITVQMLDRYDATRRRGYRLCSDRSCRWSNVAEATTCWKCGQPLRAAVRSIAVATHVKDLKHIKASLARGRKEYRLSIDPFAAFEWPTVDETLPRALELAEVTKLNAVADEQWQVYIFVGIVSGMRPVELIGCRWSDVDLDRGVCTLRSTKGNRDRLAYFDDHAVALLRNLRAGRRVVGPVDTPVFVREDGKRPGAAWSASYLVATWHQLREKCGVTHCTPKDLRKTCGTNLAEAGINQRIAREVTGHSSTEVLEQYYQLARTTVAREAVTKATAPLRRALGVG